MINKENPKACKSIAEHICHIMKSTKSKKVTIKQLEQAITHMKQNPDNKSNMSHKSKKFFEKLWKNDQK